jgi:predicted phosphodiesterase
VRIAFLSDLHLGTRTRTDLLRFPAVRARVMDRLRGFDEVVLLGDTIELRDRPLDVALEAAAPFFAELGAALGNGRVVVVPGNHDHRLIEEALGAPRAGTTLVREIKPGCKGASGALRDLVGTELVLAYPGWRATDAVWATHGHYLDAHSAAPTLECIAAALTGLARRRPAMRASSQDDYEAVLEPAYRLYYEIAQRPRLHRFADAAKLLVRRLERGLGTRDPAASRSADASRTLRLRGGRLGPAPGELSRPGLHPFRLVLERLRVEAEHVVFGHTHRAGPLPDDAPDLWRLAGGPALWNTGSWVYEPGYVGALGHRSPYWPGTMVTLEGSGAPRTQRLLPTLPEGVGAR